MTSQNPLLLISSFSFEKEKSTGAWSFEIGVRISAVDANSWRLRDKKVIKSALNKTRRMLLGKSKLFYFCISYSPDITCLKKSYASLSSISLAKYFLFKVAFPPAASSFELKNRLKFPARIMCLFS